MKLYNLSYPSKYPTSNSLKLNQNIFLKKFHKFNNNSFKIALTWKRWNIRSLFPLKDRSVYKSCVIYKEGHSCGSRYIGDTKSNAEVRWNEHNNLTKSSEPSKHLRSYINHCFTWAVISNAPKNAKARKNLEAWYAALWKPNLNKKRTLKD